MYKIHNKILIIYTGGTIGMIENQKTGALTSFDFSNIEESIPEIKKFNFDIDTIEFENPIDSSDIDPEFWIKLAKIIKQNYNDYDGFVILHGTDTMSYTGSALSYMLQNLNKSIVLTGSQLPIGMLRTDGKENLITAIEIASKTENGQSIVPEVCIYFENKLFRANRTIKYNAEYFNAFASENYPALANIGINIKFNYKDIYYRINNEDFKINTKLDSNVGILKIFPGISKQFVESVLNTKNLKGLVLETFGSGNATTQQWFIKLISKAIKNGIIIVNVTQCIAGSIHAGKYETSIALYKAGIINGYDITSEAAITKLMFLLGQNFSKSEIKTKFESSISGEITKINL
jgi:L-asparaginase